MLNTRVEISSRYWKDLPILVENGLGVTQKIVPFPHCTMLTMVVPHHFIELNHLTSSHSLHFFYHPDRFFFDEDINTNDTSTPTQVPAFGPITHAHAR